MNERYTYGYNNGWNVENEYINSLSELMNDYTEQISKLEEINKAIETSQTQINLNNNKRDTEITDEQIRAWYNEDYLLNGSLLSFDAYKRDILAQLQKSNSRNRLELNNENENLKSEILRKQNEYVANIYYLIDIKNETRKSILKRKNNLSLLLSEKRIQLSSVLLEQQRTKPQYDDSGNILNSKDLIALRNKYDSIWLEIRKIEHALQKLDEMFALVEFTKEENDLMMRGLNPQQRDIYDQLIVPETSLEPISEPTPEPILEPTPEPIPEPTPEPTPEPIPEPTPEPIQEPQYDEQLTLEGIIEKICGEKSFNDSQSSRYAASKIKVFSKPQKNRLGLSYKIVSIPRTVIGIIPKTAMKLYGIFISKKTKDIFREMEERANNLTDKEVEILLDEYKGARAQSFRLPKGFNNAVRPRIDKYVGTKVAKINEQIFENLRYINFCEKVINTLNSKLEEENTPEMIARIHSVLDKAYGKAYPAVKSIISLQIEGNKLQNGNGLHSFDEELKALNTKMNYIGGRFSKAREYEPKLWSKVSSYSHRIEYSTDPREVVDSFIERERIYKENTKERRSILNLGSKVTVGKLDYRPFVETLNYGNDPFIRDLITSVLVVSSTASLINNIKNSMEASARQQNIINDINSKIEQTNKVGAEHQQFIENVRGSGDSIEKGMVYDVKHTEGSIENLAERGVNSEHGWVLSGKSYNAADTVHHLESGSLSVQNTEALLDLSSKYSSGAITHAEYLRGIHELKEQTTEVYERYVSELSTTLENYAASHPQFDYTAVLSALRHASTNPGDSVELSEVITNLYEQSLNVSNFESLSAIEATLSTPNLVPDLLTLGAVTAKVAQEQVDSKKEIKPDSRRAKEIREMIESLKSMKAELSEEEVKEIENLLR